MAQYNELNFAEIVAKVRDAVSREDDVSDAKRITAILKALPHEALIRGLALDFVEGVKERNDAAADEEGDESLRLSDEEAVVEARTALFEEARDNGEYYVDDILDSLDELIAK